jgi:hypothetical protein
VPPRRVPLTPTSATFIPSSPKQHSVSPIPGISTDSPSTDIKSASSTPVAKTVPQLRSMDTLALSPNSTSVARGHRSNPTSPARNPPTTRSAILARKKADAEAAAAAAAANLSPTGHHPDLPPASSSLAGIGEPSSSIVVSPPQDAESTPPKAGLDTSVQMLLHAMELGTLRSSLTTGTVATSSSPLVPSIPAKQAESSLSIDNNQCCADSHSLFPRSYTLSTASTPSFATSTSTSSDRTPPATAPMRSTAFFSPSSESFRRFDTVPATPPVPVVPEKYQPSASMAASIPELNSPGHINSTAAARTGVSSSVAKSVMINEATPVDVELGIAIIGASKCGKSEFIWKGMKVWGLDPSSTLESHCGISIIKRVALPSTSTSSNGNTSPPKPEIQSPLEKFMERERLIDDDSASTLHEHRRIAKVTLYEVDSAALFAQRGVMLPRKGWAVSEDSGYGDGSQWVWPTGMPRIDGVMLCYDASDAKSTDRLDELCGTLTYISFTLVLCWQRLCIWCFGFPSLPAHQLDVQRVASVLLHDCLPCTVAFALLVRGNIPELRCILHIRLLHIASHNMLGPTTRVACIRVLICAFGHIYRVMRRMITHLWTDADRMLMDSAYICWLRYCEMYSGSVGCHCSLCRSVDPHLIDN